ncbi:hypothetical protein SAMN05445060_1929 [Williamsia sterculiae]|uniref:Uncharacterized protein n=1 Tax=Williamsia sterculiae TaxID=1344003 RepID=A0A1N7FCH0_9NOCA|nr:hypothetical protein SAMN05445060_1929 [Williamsia sterculiae]
MWLTAAAAALVAGATSSRAGGRGRYTAIARASGYPSVGAALRSWLPGGGSERATVGPSQLVLINDPTSPREYVFHENVPPGGHISTNPDGSATIYDRNGNPVEQIGRPWAYDSLGRAQRTWYTVDDNGDLVQHVDPAPNALYPILADPPGDSPGAGSARAADEASMDAYDREFGETAPANPSPANFRQADEQSMDDYDTEFSGTAPSNPSPADFRQADEQSMDDYDTEYGGTAPAGAGDFRQADEQSMDDAFRADSSGGDSSTGDPSAGDASRVGEVLPAGVAVPQRGDTTTWEDGNGSQRSLTIDQYGQRVWTTQQSDGTVITVTEGGGSDGADKPWTRTEITRPDGTTDQDYDSDGVTGYTWTDDDGVDHRLMQYSDGDVGEQTFSGGDEGSHPPESTITRQSGDGSLFVTTNGYDGYSSQYSNIPDPNDGGYSERVTNSDGSESFQRVTGGSDGADRPSATGYSIGTDGLRRDWTTSPSGVTDGRVTGRDGSDQGTFGIDDHGTFTFRPSQQYLSDNGLESRIITITPNGWATTTDRVPNLDTLQTHMTQFGELPWQHPETPERGAARFGAVWQAIKQPFDVLGDEVGNHFYGPIAQTVTNPTQPYVAPEGTTHSPGEVAWSAAEIGSLFIPGEGAARGLGAVTDGLRSLRGAETAVPKLPEATLAPRGSVIYPSAPIGSTRNEVPTVLPGNNPAIINGMPYSGHAIDRLQGRGIMPSVVQNTIDHGISYPGRTPDTTVFFDPVNNISVIQDNIDGTIISLYPGRARGGQ